MMNGACSKHNDKMCMAPECRDQMNFFEVLNGFAGVVANVGHEFRLAIQHWRQALALQEQLTETLLGVHGVDEEPPF